MIYWYTNVRRHYVPFAKSCRHVNDGFRALDVTETLGEVVEHFVGGVGLKTTDVDICVNVSMTHVKAKRGIYL